MKMNIGHLDLGKVFFTADSHFGHENIIKFCNRPFVNASEMDREMERRWCEIVPDDGIVFHLGDFTLGGDMVADGYFQMLTGEIKMLSNPWHHDKRWLLNPDMHYATGYGAPVVLLPPMVVLEVPQMEQNGYPLAITLCHYPIGEWDRKHYGAWHLHGHSHGNYKYVSTEKAIDVGVDCWDFRPVSFSRIAERMTDY